MMKQSLINLILFSDRRKDLLLLLKEKPRDVNAIKELLKADASSIQPHIKKMKDSGLVTEKNKIYRLSAIGEIIVENMQPLLSMAELFGENNEYWLNHDLSSIPEFLLERIDELGHCELLEPDMGHLVETPKTLMDSMLSSKGVLTFTTYSSWSLNFPSFSKSLSTTSLSVTINDGIIAGFRNIKSLEFLARNIFSASLR
jgi:predicted transcriptional regulator